LSVSHNGNFSKIGGKSLAEITSEGGKTTWNKICWENQVLGVFTTRRMFFLEEFCLGGKSLGMITC
jgi:hypothetical protein